VRDTDTQFRDLADSVPVFLYLLGPDGRPAFLNRPLLQFHGLSAEEFAHLDPSAPLHPDDRAHGFDAFFEAFRRRQPFRAEFRMRRADGVYRWFFNEAVPRFAPDGEFLGYVGACIDVTDRKEAEVELRARNVRIQDLAGRLIAAQEAERTRIAREIHDDVNQELAALAIALSAVRRRLPAGADDVRAELARLQWHTVELSNDLRQLSHELHPGVLKHAGLVAALRGHCAEFRGQHPVEVTFEATGELDGVPADVALCLYRVAQEALRNVGRHAAALRATVILARTDDGLELTVADDGRGFDRTATRRAGGLGLLSLDERVRLVGGSVRIDTEPRRGTTLRVRVPWGGRAHDPGAGAAGR
jgi:PAS domain S-box-containing protein